MTTIKNTLIGLCALALLAACSKEDDGPAYSFKDQDLQGKIGGAAFVMGDGRFEVGFLEDDWFIEIYHQDEDQDICVMEEAAKSYVMFSVPDEVGVYKLFLNLGNLQGQVVTLYDVVEEVNNIATVGAIEILDISENEITGRVDARMDSKNFVNGNFTVTLCETEQIPI